MLDSDYVLEVKRSPSHLNSPRRFIAAICLGLMLVLGLYMKPAQAQFATGGSGAYRSQIVWFSWGTDGATIPEAGVTLTNSYPIAGNFLRVTCSLSNITGTSGAPNLKAYRPGNWTGDALDNLYYIGGSGTSNALVVGLAHRLLDEEASARFSCSATYGSSNSAADPVYPLEGLVFADAEQSRSDQRGGEFVSATIPLGGTPAPTWRLIERFSACSSTSSVTVTTTATTSTLRFNGVPLAELCTEGGPIGIALMENATSADFRVYGGGGSAIALGVMVFVADSGDAPASYGNVSHLPGFTWTGGSPAGSSGGTNTNFFGTYQLAALAPANIRLGAATDTENTVLSGTGATGDDTSGTDDEDALGAISAIQMLPGANYSLNVTCGTSGTVYGYIDFNRDGDFLDANERSAASTCAAGNAALIWTMPSITGMSGGTSYLRLRTGSVVSQVSTPVGSAADGEVEDYQVTLQMPATLRIQKTRVSNAGGPVDFVFSGDGPDADTVYTPSTQGDDRFTFWMSNSSSQTHDYGSTTLISTTGSTALNNLVPGTYTITEAFTDGNNNDFELTNVSCVNQTGGVVGSSWTSTLGANGGSAAITLVPGANYLCTFTNTRDPHIVVTKELQGASSASGFNYTVTATGSGAIVGAPFNLAPVTNGTAQQDVEVRLASGTTTRNVTITETQVSGYILTSASCTKNRTGSNGLPLSTTVYPASQGSPVSNVVTINDFTVDDTASCTFVNAQQPTVVFRKQSNGGTGTFAFTGGTNLATPSFNLDTSTTNPVQTAAINITAPGQAVTLTETVPNGWALSGVTCVNGASTPVVTTLTGSTLTIPGGATGGSAQLTCTFTNTRNRATVALSKVWVGAAVGDTYTLTVTGGSSPLSFLATANSSDELDQSPSVAQDTLSQLTLSETAGANTGLYIASSWTCTGTSGLSGNVLTIGANDRTIVCSITNARRRVDLSVAKQNNTPSGGTLVSGENTTYTIVVTNRGPDSVTGAVVTDQPTSGLNCPTTNVVSCSGQGCAGASPSFTATTPTMSNLTTGGITLGTMGPTSAGDTTLTFTCQVL